MQQEYVKTGEDNDFEYYRNDSEVLSGDGEEEIYEEILNKKEEFPVKINNKELKINKRTLNKIMILSDSQPEEQILFSLYKTVEQNISNDKIKTQTLSNENKKSENKDKENLNKVPPLLYYKKIDEPLSEKNNNNNIAINVSLPSSVNEIKSYNNDSENLMFKKTENSGNLLVVALPPKAVKIKWFYLLLVLCGIINIIYFFYCLFKIHFLFNIFLIMLFGIFHIITGFIGHNKINNKIYNDKNLFILTVISSILPIINLILILIKNSTKGHIIFGLIINIISIIFAILCIVFTEQLKKDENIIKISQMEKLL